MVISIRKLTIYDTDRIVKWRNQDFVLENFIDQRKLTRENHIAYYHSRIETKEVIQYIIVCDQIDIGTVFLRDIDYKNGKAEFGIFIGEKRYIGKGIGSKVVELILQEAFNNLHLNKVFLRVLSKNERAIKSYIKSGFKIDGCFREDIKVGDAFEDIMFMSVLRREFCL